MIKEKEITCILCPNGCDIKITYTSQEIQGIDGATCSKGNDYAKQEFENPVRTLTSSILVKGGDSDLVSVKTDEPIPLEKIMSIMEILKTFEVKAPVMVGDVLLENPADLNCKLIATREIKRK